MYILMIQRGPAAEVLAVSKDLTKLQIRMKTEVLGFLSEVYGDDEDLEWMMPVRDDMMFWSDEDEEYRTTFTIETAEEI